MKCMSSRTRCAPSPGKYYPDGDIYLAGDATSGRLPGKSFAIDNIVVSVVSVLMRADSSCCSRSSRWQCPSY